jgi:RNA polymerase sigma-70 factor (ECF subfamily)
LLGVFFKSVVLKDVFDYTLEEISELVSSTVGGVKAALNRGLERFNGRDWNGTS